MSRWKRSNGTAEAQLPDPGAVPPSDSTAGASQVEKPRDVGSRWGRGNVPDPDAIASCIPESRTFNFQSSVTLRGGVQMPILGLGTRQLKGNECREAVKHALRCGYRLLDTAPGFGNDEEIAHGIRGASLKREDVFLVSKLPPSEHGDELEEPLTSSLQHLGTSYLDLYLIQSPKGGSLLWTWDAMLQLRERGLVKAVGLCNVSVAHLEALARTGRELPQVLQTELHVAHQQKDLCDFCRSHGIILMSTSPLARGALLKTSPLRSMAERLRRTAAEVAIRWCLQQGFVTIPKTKTAARLESNAAFGFTLTEEDMKFLSMLDLKMVASSSSQSAMELSWEDAVGEVSEVSDGDVGDDASRPRRRRRRKRKGKGQVDGKGKGKGGNGGKGAPSGGPRAAQRAADVLFRLS